MLNSKVQADIKWCVRRLYYMCNPLSYACVTTGRTSDGLWTFQWKKWRQWTVYGLTKLRGRVRHDKNRGD